MVSPSKFVAVSTNCERSMSSNVLTLTTPYRVPSITQVTMGKTPQVVQTRKSAVFVPKRYRLIWVSSVICSSKLPPGCDVQTARCFVQSEQPQARTGMLGPELGHAKVKRMFPQWQLPRIWRTLEGSCIFTGSLNQISNCCRYWIA